MSNELLLQRHSELMEAEIIAIEAFQKLEKTGLNLEIALILFLHHAIMKPSVTHLSHEQELTLHEYIEGWLQDCRRRNYG